MWMMDASSDGFEMVVMLSAEGDRDVMQCNAMMGARGEERGRSSEPGRRLGGSNWRFHCQSSPTPLLPARAPKLVTPDRTSPPSSRTTTQSAQPRHEVKQMITIT